DQHAAGQPDVARRAADRDRAPSGRARRGRAGSVCVLSPRRTPTPTELAVAEAASLQDARRAAGAADARDATAGASTGGAGSSDPLVSGLRRAGLLRLLVLRLCGDEPSYGNQLMERIGELTGGLLAVNPNTMYPLLRQLEGDGLIAGEWEHPERRSRRFYRLTADGEAERTRLALDIAPRLDAAAAAIDAIRTELRDGSA
ncbi:MAG: PadR family transcriptional regulator, partial [Solirubrobacterales bacterium]|nr:PadR family transcriptional regulator [Solirubrobacterales bacterium]